MKGQQILSVLVFTAIGSVLAAPISRSDLKALIKKEVAEVWANWNLTFDEDATPADKRDTESKLDKKEVAEVWANWNLTFDEDASPADKRDAEIQS